MRNRGFIIVLTIIVTALCLYYLSFTVISRRIQQQATQYATSADKTIDLAKKQRYLDSLWNKPVYNVFGAQYTYREVKETELSLGLDLQGGMHVILEISPADILRGLSGNRQDPAFVAALTKAVDKQKTSNESFSKLFVAAYEEANPTGRLATLFASSANKEKIKITDDNQKVESFLNAEIDDAINRSFIILQTRIDQFGTSQPNIQRLPGTGRIQIEIPGASNPQRVRKLLQGVAHLEFWEVIEYTDPMLSKALFAINDLLMKENVNKTKTGTPLGVANSPAVVTQEDSVNTLAAKLKQASRDSSASTLDSLKNNATSRLFAFSQNIPFLYDVKDTTEINAIFRRPDVQSIMPSTVGVYWDVKSDPDVTPGIEDIQLFFLNIGRLKKPLLSGEVITDARLEYDQFARPAVSMSMSAAGSKAWAKITAAESSKQPQGRIAIVLDNYVYTAPTVQGEIPNGNSQITGKFSIEEAKDLANVLKAGSLPAPTHIVEYAIVGANLGKAAQNQGIISIGIGLLLVVLFMVVYYGKSGLVANAALLFNIFFILGILAQFNAALTLPGIAGIVLTMGMAVDANVLVFERIKEELLAGRNKKEAVKKGYSLAFSTIFDSNLTTLLTGIFLFLLGQGPLRGFAIVLIIGIVTSFFSAVYISHVIIDWMVNRAGAKELSFDTPISRFVKRRPKFEFIKKRYYSYAISSSVIIIGFLLIAVNGLNMGVDFKGGRSFKVMFNKPVVATDMLVSLRHSFKGSSTEVKNFGGNNVMKVTTSYLIEDDTEEGDEKVKQSLIEAVASFSHLQYTENETSLDDAHFAISSSTKVGATIADDIKNSALKASLYSLLAIFLYLLLRFKKWTFSAGAVVATAHDALFVIAVFGIANTLGFGFEIDQIFVAAMLTIIGYSINDTVIIFDRIREYIKFGSSHDRQVVFNDAINTTLSRTIITSGTTLLVVLVLLFFGGEVLRGFSFALFLGILMGTYSSVLIAAPVVIDLERIFSKKGKTPTASPKR